MSRWSIRTTGVELDDHSLIFAESVPAETFVDNVDRMNFDNWQEHQTLYPENRAIRELEYPRAKSHRQVLGGTRALLAEREKNLTDCGCLARNRSLQINRADDNGALGAAAFAAGNSLTVDLLVDWQMLQFGGVNERRGLSVRNFLYSPPRQEAIAKASVTWKDWCGRRYTTTLRGRCGEASEGAAEHLAELSN